jgi:hypothetical protein
LEVFKLNDNTITLDENEAKKRYLKRYRKNRALINRLKNKVIDYEERLSSIRASTVSDMPRGGVPTPREDIISDKLETEARIRRLEEKGKIIRAEIIDKLDELDNVNYVSVLEAFCIECKDFNEIADSIGYSERHVIAIYTKAIEAVNL